ncbi:N(6)-hydroxylysine O-acetyltransferase [compost metagenome]
MNAIIQPAPVALPPKPRGEVYRHRDPALGLTFSLRTLDIDADLERFNRWQNNPRVAHFWQEQGDLDAHREYLRRIKDDPHVFSLLGCFDGEPFAYYEVYWAVADRIAPFYEVGQFDRGIHMLVGEEHHRGPAKVRCWLRSLVSYLLLDEPRTTTVVAEPRADNARMIGYMESVGFRKEKEFDFPHKRAALMRLEREGFQIVGA